VKGKLTIINIEIREEREGKETTWWVNASVNGIIEINSRVPSLTAVKYLLFGFFETLENIEERGR